MANPTKPRLIPTCTGHTATTTSFSLSVDSYAPSDGSLTEIPYKVTLYRNGIFFKENSVNSGSTIFYWTESAGETHTFYVIIKDANNHVSPQSNTWTIKSIPNIPAITVGTVTTNTIAVSWTGTAPAYLITGPKIVDSYTQTSYTFTSLEANKSYTIRVYPKILDMFAENGSIISANATTVGTFAATKTITTNNDVVLYAPTEVLPSINWHTPANGAFVNTQAITTKATISDGNPTIQSVTFVNVSHFGNRYPASTFAPDYVALNFALVAGQNLLECIVYNTAGREIKQQKTVIYDPTPPLVKGISWTAQQSDNIVRDMTVVTGTSLFAYSNEAKLKIEAEDSLSGIAAGKVLQNGQIIEEFTINPAQTKISKTISFYNLAFNNGMNQTNYHNLVVQIIDVAGNVGQLSLTVTRGTGTPSIAVTIPSENGFATNKNPLALAGTCKYTDSLLGQMFLTGVSTSYGTTSNTLLSGTTWSGAASLKEGETKILFTAKNIIGVSATTERVVIYDATPPEVVVTKILGTNSFGKKVEIPVQSLMKVYGPIITVTATATDNNSKVAAEQVYLRESLAKTITVSPRLATHSFSFDVDLVSGNNTLAIKSTDGAGNIGTAKFGNIGAATITYVTDNEGPQTTIDWPIEGSFHTANNPLSGLQGTWADDNDITSILVSAYSPDGTTKYAEQLLQTEAVGAGTGIEHITPTNGKWRATLSSTAMVGEIEMRVEATDKLGAKSTVKRKFWIDNVAPNPIITTPTNGEIRSSSQVTVTSWADDSSIGSGLKEYGLKLWQNGIAYFVGVKKDLFGVYGTYLKNNNNQPMSEVVVLREGTTEIVVEYIDRAGNSKEQRSTITYSLAPANAPSISISPDFGTKFTQKELAFDVRVYGQSNSEMISSIDVDVFPYATTGSINTSSPFYRKAAIRSESGLLNHTASYVVKEGDAVVPKITAYNSSTIALGHLNDGEHTIKITAINKAGKIKEEWRTYVIDTARIVANINPSNNSTNVSSKEPIVITFSAPVNQATAIQAIQLGGSGMQGVTGTWSWNSSLMATYSHTQFVSGGSVTVNLLGNVAKNATMTKYVDAASATFSVTDTTILDVDAALVRNTSGGTVSLGVISTSPVLNIDTGTNISVRFSKLVERNTIIVGTTAILKDEMGNYIDLLSNFEISEANMQTTVKFQPRSALQYTTKYTLQLTSGIKDKSGNSLRGNYGFPYEGFFKTGGSGVSEALQVEQPRFDPPGGTYSQATSVRISCMTSGATIYYEVGGASPNMWSPTYSSPIPLKSGTTTIKAMGVKTGVLTSNQATATYTINNIPSQDSATKVATPSIIPNGGTYTDSTPQINITTTTMGATIFIGRNTSTPNEMYTGPVQLTQTTDLVAMGIKSGMTNSNIVTARFTVVKAPIKLAMPTITPNGGTFEKLVFVSIRGEAGATIYYSIDNGTTNIVSGNILITKSCTIQAYATKSGAYNSDVANATITITGGVAEEIPLAYSVEITNGLNGLSIPLDSRQGKYNNQTLREFLVQAIPAGTVGAFFWYDTATQKWVSSLPGGPVSRQFDWHEAFFVNIAMATAGRLNFSGYVIEGGSPLLRLKKGFNLVGFPVNMNQLSLKQIAEYIIQRAGGETLVMYLSRKKTPAESEKQLLGYTYTGPESRNGISLAVTKIGGDALGIVSPIDIDIPLYGIAWQN